MEGLIVPILSGVYLAVSVAYYLTWRKIVTKTYLHLLGSIVFSPVCLPCGVVVFIVKLLNKPLPKKWGC